MYRLFQRIANIFKAKAEKAVDNMENPVEMMHLATIEFEEAIKSSQKALVDVMADLKMKEKTLEQATLTSKSWWDKAKMAQKQNNAELAKQALEQKAISDTKVNEFTALVTYLQQNVELLKKQLERNKLKLEEVKSKESIFAAKAETAKSQTKLQESLGGLNNNALSNLSKYEEQINKLEAKSNALTELNNVNTRLEDEFRELESSSKVYSDFELLEEELQKEEQEKTKKLEEKNMKFIEASIPNGSNKNINKNIAVLSSSEQRTIKLEIPEGKKEDKLKNLFNN